MFWLGRCDFIGRTETIDADLEFIGGRIAQPGSWWGRIRLRGPLDHQNRTHHADCRRFYDDQGAEFIARHFAPEAERFGYRFDPARESDTPEQGKGSGNGCAAPGIPLSSPSRDR